MRSYVQQRLSLAQRFADETKLAVFEIAQTAMNQSRRSTRRAAADISLVEQEDFQAAQRRITSDTGAVDSRANNNEIEVQFDCRLPIVD